MKIRKTKRFKKTLFIAFVLVFLILVGFGYYLTFLKGNLFGWGPFVVNKSSTNYDAPTDEQLQAGDDITDRAKKSSNNGTDPNSVGSDQGEKSTSQAGQSKKSVSVSFSSVNQNDGILQIRIEIAALTNEGRCSLKLTNETKSFTSTANVQALSNTSTCKGFNIPVSELSKGKWSAGVIFDNPSLMGSASSEVTVI
jgi:hypothetical protein